MAIEHIIVSKALEHVLDKSLKYLFTVSQSDPDQKSALGESVELALKTQFDRAQTFCNSLELFKYDDNRCVSENTIDLAIRNSTRQSFKSLEDFSLEVSELSLLTGSESQLILGDPGSGKTTTLKRLVDESIRCIFEVNDDQFPYSFPLFFKLAEIPPAESLFLFLAKHLGVSYNIITREVSYDSIQKERVYSPNKPPQTKMPYTELENGYYEIETTVTKSKTIFDYKVGNIDLSIAIIALINSQNAIVFLDGLDEIHYQVRSSVFSDIKILLSSLNSSKLIITSRYFEDVDCFKNISKNEILPLSKEKALQIIRHWLPEPENFWSTLGEKPYKELASRPLFLFYLVMLYRSNKEILPTQGIDVYQQVILLVLREWDQQKEHSAYRYSKIKNFDTYKKEEFIGDIAFYLTYKLGVKKVFSHKDLIQAYLNVHTKHPQLHSDDAKSVIHDIETDNALIITSYENEYEFTHLSLQEYLCARHILTIPFSRKIYDYLTINPEPLALAVMLSTDPSGWFSVLILNNINEPQFDRKLTPTNVYLFLNRLITEGAIFNKPVIELGMAVLFLIFTCSYSKQTGQCLVKFLKNESVLIATKMAMAHFKILHKGKDKEKVEIMRKSTVNSDFYLKFPEKGSVPIYIWKCITVVKHKKPTNWNVAQQLVLPI